MAELTIVRPDKAFRRKPPEFWALVKLVSWKLGYSERGTGGLKRYRASEVVLALESRGLDPGGYQEVVERVAAYSEA